MDNRFEITRLILVLLSLGTVLAENWANLRSKDNEYIPSRVLKWLPKNSSETFRDAVLGFSEYVPIGPIADKFHANQSEVAEFRFYICRVYDPKNGNVVLGTVQRSSPLCQIRESKSSEYYVEHYEVLHNLRGAVQLKWKSIWDEIPPNAVAVDDGYIISRIGNNIDKIRKVPFGKSQWIVKINSEPLKEWISMIQDDDIIPYLTLAETLVEVEPVLYQVNISQVSSELDSNMLNRTEKLGEITLRNTLQRSTIIESVIPYNWSSSWSFNDTILDGVNIVISTNDSNLRDRLGWGEITGNEEIHNELHRVSAYLPANAGVQITLQAKRLNVEDTLVGSLSTFFDDDGMRTETRRPISAVWQRTVLTDLETTYGSIFHLPNNSTAAATNLTLASSRPTVAIGPSTSATLTSPSFTTLTSITNSPITVTSRSKLVPKTSTPSTTSTPQTTTVPPQSTTTSTPPYTTVHSNTTVSPTITPTQPYTTKHPSSTSTSITTTTTTTTPPPSPSPSTTIQPSSTTTNPTPTSTTTPSNTINLDMSVYFRLKMKIPVK